MRSCTLTDLPDGVLRLIFKRINMVDTASLRRVCKRLDSDEVCCYSARALRIEGARRAYSAFVNEALRSRTYQGYRVHVAINARSPAPPATRDVSIDSRAGFLTHVRYLMSARFATMSVTYINTVPPATTQEGFGAAEDAARVLDATRIRLADEAFARLRRDMIDLVSVASPVEMVTRRLVEVQTTEMVQCGPPATQPR